MNHFAAIAVALAVAGPAAADTLDAPDRARTLSDQGRAYHANGDYDHAIVSFRAAYELAPSPGLLFNLAQAFRLKGDCASAATMYRSYLRSEPDKLHRELAEGQLDTVERCLTRRELLHPLIGDPGSIGGGGASGTAMLSIDHTPGRPGAGLRRGGTVLAIGGGALIGASIYYAVKSSDYSSQVEQMYADGAKWKDIEPIDSRGRRASTLSTVFAIGGGAAAITGGLLYLVGRREGQRAESARTISVTPMLHGGQVEVAWAF